MTDLLLTSAIAHVRRAPAVYGYVQFNDDDGHYMKLQKKEVLEYLYLQLRMSNAGEITVAMTTNEHGSVFIR